MVAPIAAAAETYELTPQQLNFFNTFGYLKVPGLFAEDAAEISDAFDAVFADEANERMEIRVPLHDNQRRVIIPAFIDKHPKLDSLRSDPRVLGIVHSIIGDEYVYAESDGNLFDCESSWHPDIYGAQMKVFHLKLSFYLEPLRADTGAIRVIPGSHHKGSTFAGDLWRGLIEPEKIEANYGIAPRDVPSVAVETDPGDLVMWNYRTVHASWYGGHDRRLFSMSFREPGGDPPPADA